MVDHTQEATYYSAILDQDLSGLEDFQAERFVPSNGTVLVVLPPAKEETAGGVRLPSTAIEKPNVGRVASIPEDDPKCPVQPGDWVVWRQGDGQPVKFDGRTDMELLQYADDARSEILGCFKLDCM